MGSIRKEGNSWRAEVCVAGRRKSKNHKLKRDAQAWVLKVESEGLDSSPSTVTLRDLVRRYIKEVVPEHKGAKQEALRLNRLIDELPGGPVCKLTASDFSDWKQFKLSKVSAPTVRRYMTALNSVFNHAVSEWQAIYKNPMAGVKKPKSAPPRDRVPQDIEIEWILKELNFREGEPVVTKQQQIAVTLLIAVETAMRAGEILSLNRGNVDYVSQVATLVDTKNGDSREVPLSKRALVLLRSVDPVYFTVSKAVHSQLFRRAVKNAGIDDLRFHDSRAAGLMKLSKKVDVLTLARIVGHRDIKSLMIYYRETAADIAKLLD